MVAHRILVPFVRVRVFPRQHNNNYTALWCNGSTPDSGSVCESSSLSKATEQLIIQLLFVFYNLSLYAGK